MKFFMTGCLLFLFIAAELTYSQQVTINIHSDHQQLQRAEFPTPAGTVNFSGNRVLISGGVESYSLDRPSFTVLSPGAVKTGLITSANPFKRLTVDYHGRVVSETELPYYDPSDGSISLVQFDNGSSMLIDNIATFTFFDAAGKETFSFSNSTQSPDGERPSKAAYNRSGSVIVAYNPEVRSGGNSGSRASLVNPAERTAIPFFDSRNRIITSATVSEHGSYIKLISQAGSDATVHIFDRFGNKLYELNPDLTPKGATLSSDGRYLTVYSSSRAQVYHIITGERLGSASLRGNVVFASYQPADDTIILVGGDETEASVSNPGITAVHIGRRQIARGEINTELSRGWNNIEVVRTGANRYRVTGFNKELEVTTSF